MDLNDHQHWMGLALEQARKAGDKDEVPVGAVIVLDGKVLGVGHNQPITTHDCTAHAEIMALREACSHVGNYRLPGATLYVTIEPCTMCVGAMIHARIGTIVYGAREPRAGALDSNLALHDQPFYNHRLKVTGGVLEGDCSALMQAFFRSRRPQGQ